MPPGILAFHCVAMALIDPDFAKDQLILFLREWYMHPNGELPAYEWNFSDVNPPVHAWAAWRVYKIDRAHSREDGPQISGARFSQAAAEFHLVGESQGPEGKNVFEGGFLGLDNIGVFDRSTAARARQFHRAVRRHQLDGHVLPEHAGHGHRAGARGPGLRGRGQQILRAFRLHFARP